MSCCNKDCDCHQNSSFLFGIFIGLIIGAVIAIVIYKKNREKVFTNLKKKLEKIYHSFTSGDTFKNFSSNANKIDINNSVKVSKNFSKKTPKKPASTLPKLASVKLKTPISHKIAVTLPDELLKKEFQKSQSPPKTKPRIFKK